MANEATITGGLFIKNGNIEYQSRPTAFQADVTGTKGPTPGAIAVSTSGVDVSLAELGTPGLCRLMNLTDDDNIYITYGIWDPESTKFYPLGELLAGESYVIRLARDIQEEYGAGAGTGTTGADTNKLRLKAIGGAAVALVEAFEK